MKITLSKEQVKPIYKGLEELGVDFGYGRTTKHVDLSEMSLEQIDKLRKVFADCKEKKFILPVRIIDEWKGMFQGNDAKVRKLHSFAGMLKAFYSKIKDKWIYIQDKFGHWQPWFIWKIEFIPADNRHGYHTPASVVIHRAVIQFGYRETEITRFHASDCVGFTVLQSLSKKNIRIESKQIRADYEALLKKYDEYFDKVGMQCTATGFGEGEKVDYLLDKEGIPAKIVIDIPFEDDEESSQRDSCIDEDFWHGFEGKIHGSKKKGDEDADEEDDEEDEGEDNPRDLSKGIKMNVPTRPIIRIFDLKGQYNCIVSVSQLEKYVYQTDIQKNLVLPANITNFITAITTRAGRFRDIVEGKSGGQIILCAGPPGCGKTLTAEVFSESQERPLYTVQCSQLGLNAKALEENLERVFRRSIRWNAILLLDESDVYIMKRGKKLKQNAIVGVFLRVLEYYRGVMFMTTNRGDCIDDAIASRCLARIDYQIPDREGLARIWQTLAGLCGVKIEKKELDKILDSYPNISGRDVKNLLKLALMTSTQDTITHKIIETCETFKPVKGN